MSQREAPKLIGERIIKRRIDGQIGFVPSIYRPMGLFVPVPEYGPVQFIGPSIKSWSEMIDSGKKAFVLSSGDYRHLGVLELNGLDDVTIISNYDDQNDYPVIEAVSLRNCRNIYFSKLRHSGIGKTIQGIKAGIGSTVRDCEKITWNLCVFENPANGLFRVLDSNYCTFQRCIFRRAPEIRGDRSGVGFSATRDKESRGNVVAACEFYDLTDGVGAPASYAPNTMPGPNDIVGPVPGLKIVGNHFYLTEYSYPDPVARLTACAENALDFKVGGTSWHRADQVLVAYNIMHGYRPTDQNCGGTGDAGGCVTIHRHAQYIRITDNVMFDTGYGVAVYPEKDEYPYETVKEIVIENNLFHRMVNAANDTTINGIAARLAIDDVVFQNNTVAGAVLPYYRKPGTNPTINGNIYFDNAGTVNYQGDRRNFYGTVAIDGMRDLRVLRTRIAPHSKEPVNVPIFYGCAPTNKRNYVIE